MLSALCLESGCTR